MNKIQSALKRFPSLWLLIGVAIVVATQNRWGVGVLIWVMPIPFIQYLRKSNGYKSRLFFFAAMLLAWSLAFLKILTDPLPVAMAPLFGIPVALFHGIPYIISETVRRRIGDGLLSSAVFAGLVTIGEWSMHTFTPFASWGAAAYTQVEYPTILQLVSVAGMGGLAFVIYFAASTLEQLFTLSWRDARNGIVTALILVAILVGFGNARFAAATESEVKTVLLGAVESDLRIKPGASIPTQEELKQFEAALRERTSRAAGAGARLVTWNEGALVVPKETEDAFIERTRSLAASHQIHLVAAYVVPLTIEPLFFENKYIWVRPNGTLDHTYIKHEPVPGEPAVKGEGPMPLVETEWGRLSGALCYDYDFPALAREQAQMDVDLVINPSNDWRGIDPIHAQMAVVRGIEGGHSVLRSTGSGLSAGSDPHGRIRGWMSSFEVEDRLLLVRLPVSGFRTIYATLGDWPIWLSGFFILFALEKMFRTRKTKKDYKEI